MSTPSLNDLVHALEGGRNPMLVLGAGISVANGIPPGYALPAQFVREEPGFFAPALVDAATSNGPFIEDFVRAFVSNPALQEKFLDWLSGFPSMAGQESMHHEVFAVSWLNRIFKHVVTTNWDFLFEWQVDQIYDQAYSGDPFEPVVVPVQGVDLRIDADRLFFAEQLDGDDVAWNPRWRIVVNNRDLPDTERWSRPLWKIHGSPFFLACPKCQGVNRWHRESPVRLGDPCPDHPECVLVPDILLWQQGIDRADGKAWHALKSRIVRADLIVVAGHSGGDTYLRRAIEDQGNVWVVDPRAGCWDLSRIRHVEATAVELATSLLPLLA